MFWSVLSRSSISSSCPLTPWACVKHCVCPCPFVPLQAGIFQYAKRITDAQAGESVIDTVITVPVWMGVTQRQAIMDAARLAGLNVLGLVNTHAAAALQFGIERDFSKKEQTVRMHESDGVDRSSCSSDSCAVKHLKQNNVVRNKINDLGPGHRIS